MYIPLNPPSKVHTFSSTQTQGFPPEPRYAVQIDGGEAEVFDIHTNDFSAEWRWNVLRGYSSRSVDISALAPGRHKVRISLLDPGIVLQEICVLGD